MLPRNFMKLDKILRNSDILIGVIVVCIVLMLIIPLHPTLLSILLIINISFSLVILMSSMFTKNALEFSVLPSLLLIMTLYRLALNVSTTRLILLDAYAGDVIQQFGELVVGGNTVVGFIIFLILVVIQFIVITKGAERVAEVAARFTLDAMPGKQMAIDADLNSGLISDSEARIRRQDIQREANFYGAMDGASKFVKGDAIAAIIIVFINLIGGFIIGLAQKGMDFSTALHTYSLLTVGDGLVTQIPALLISTATGIVVTRSADKTQLGQEIGKQLFNYPRALYIAGSVVITLGLLGFPKIPTFVIGLSLIAMGVVVSRDSQQKEDVYQEEIEETEEIRKPENVLEYLQVEKMELELGYGLIPLVDTSQGGDVLDRIIMVRRQCASELGFIVPPIRIRDNMQIKPDEYVIKIKGAKIASGQLLNNSYLVIGPDIEKDDEIKGVKTNEPAFNLPAKWITSENKEHAELKGYTVIDLPSVLITHLTQIIKEHAHEVLSRQDIQTILDFIKKDNSAIVNELIPDLISLGDLQKVLANLLKEDVPIKDMVTILETLADYSKVTKDTEILTEYVRQSLKRQITRLYAQEDNTIYAISLDPTLEEQLRNNLHSTDYGSYLSLDTKVAEAIVKNLEIAVQTFVNNQTTNPLLVCSPIIRIHFKNFISRYISHLPIVSYNELENNVTLQIVGMVSIN